MLDFLQANWMSIIVLIILACIVFLAIRKMVKDKKSGVGPCGHKCCSCPRGAACRNKDARG